MAAVTPASVKKDFAEDPVVDASRLTIQSSMTFGDGVAGYQSAAQAVLIADSIIRTNSTLLVNAKLTRNMQGPLHERNITNRLQLNALKLILKLAGKVLITEFDFIT